MDTTANPLSVIDSTVGYADTSLTITGLRNNTTYYCRLTAVDHHNNESAFSNEIQEIILRDKSLDMM